MCGSYFVKMAGECKWDSENLLRKIFDKHNLPSSYINLNFPYANMHEAYNTTCIQKYIAWKYYVSFTQLFRFKKDMTSDKNDCLYYNKFLRYIMIQ